MQALQEMQNDLAIVDTYSKEAAAVGRSGSFIQQADGRFVSSEPAVPS